MNDNFKHVSIAILCEWFGLTRQAYYGNLQNVTKFVFEEELLIKEVLKIRKSHPNMGCRKLYFCLGSFLKLHNIKIGRDTLFKILSDNCLLVRKRKSKIITTRSYEWMRKYPNLIKDFTPSKPNQLWVSDITYLQISEKVVYISLITDAFSRKIVGYNVAETLKASETIKALKMALAELPKDKSFNLIHHSDRGSQYCQNEYVALLKKSNIQISMTTKGDPLENAIAERVNGILKGEYLFHYHLKDIKDVAKLLSRSVHLYNNHRPHLSIGNFCPEYVHANELKTKMLWKNYYKQKKNNVTPSQD